MADDVQTKGGQEVFEMSDVWCMKLCSSPASDDSVESVKNNISGLCDVMLD